LHWRRSKVKYHASKKVPIQSEGWTYTSLILFPEVANLWPSSVNVPKLSWAYIDEDARHAVFFFSLSLYCVVSTEGSELFVQSQYGVARCSLIFFWLDLQFLVHRVLSCSRCRLAWSIVQYHPVPQASASMCFLPKFQPPRS
jgi:hypothetical protein